MKSIQNQYNQLLEGNLSQVNFMRAVRMTFPQYITNVTSFNDSVKILKNKGILSEALNEALNKDIKAFGQDLDKRFKEAGFDTLITMQSATPEQLNIVKTNPKAVLFSVYQNPGIQALYLYVNPSQSKKAEAIVDKFQLSNYSGPVLKRGWTAKQVQGAINPGEIVKDSNNASRGEWYFYRLASVDTKVANIKEAKKQEHQCNPVELAMGIKVEMEHTDDPKKAEKIAMDHLKENPSYYSQLKLSGIDSHQEAPKKPVAKKKAKKAKEEFVDKENAMKVVKENQEETNEVELNMFPNEQPNAAVQQAAQFIDMNNTLKPLSGEITLQNSGDNEAILKFGYWEVLPEGIVEKLLLQFDVEVDVEEHDDKAPTTAYILTPKRPSASSFRPGVDLGASFEKFKSMLENIVREVLEEENSK